MAAGRDPHGKRDRHEILSNFEWLHVVPSRTEHIFIAGELEADVHQSESANQDNINSRTADILVTAVATEIGATVATETVEGFESLDAVSVETY